MSAASRLSPSWELLASKSTAVVVTLPTCRSSYRFADLPTGSQSRNRHREISSTAFIKVLSIMLGFELTVSNSGGDYETPSAGNHAARIFGVINGGTHETAGVNGQPAKKAVKLLLVVELPYEPRSDGTPFVVLYECSAKLHPKATLRKLVNEVLNRQLNDGDRFSVTEFLGSPCAVAITHEAKGDKTYHKVASIGPPVKGMTVPEPVHPRLIWSVDGGEPFPAADWLPFHFGRSVADWIAESEEAKKSALKAASVVSPPGNTAPVSDGDIAY
jgi:hypothetical protein